MAAQRHLARSKLVEYRVFGQVEGTSVRLGKRLLSCHHQPILDSWKPDIGSPRNLWCTGYCSRCGATDLVTFFLELVILSHSKYFFIRYDWNGTAINSSRYNFTVPALNNSKIFHASGLQSILPRGKNETEVWLLLNVTASIDNQTTTNEQYVRIYVR